MDRRKFFGACAAIPAVAVLPKIDEFVGRQKITTRPGIKPFMTFPSPVKDMVAMDNRLYVMTEDKMYVIDEFQNIAPLPRVFGG